MMFRLEPEHKDAVQGLQEIESLLQGGAEEEQEDEGREGGRGERDRGRVYDEEEENKMEDSEEVLVFGPGENLEGAREVMVVQAVICFPFFFILGVKFFPYQFLIVW